jgi:hypothetical protein
MSSGLVPELLLGRDDIYFKLTFARNLILKRPGRFAHLVYAEHLFWWNKFREYGPVKRSLHDFLLSFEKLAESLTRFGFDETFEPIPRNTLGQFTNGSHRISLDIAGHQLGRDFGPKHFEVIERPQVDYSFGYFSDLGTPDLVVSLAVTEKLNAFTDPHVPVCVIWPSAQEFKPRIMKRISDLWPHLRLQLEASLSPRGLGNLVALTYADEPWCQEPSGIVAKSKLESNTKGFRQNVSLIPLEPTDSATLKDFKDSIREEWGHHFQGIHTTDTRQESVRIWTSLCTPHSLATLESVPELEFQRKQKQLRSVIDYIYEFPLGPLSTVIAGSQWMELLGVREAGDVDYLSDSGYILPGEAESHNAYVGKFGFDYREIIREPEQHIWAFGTRFAAPWVYAKLMERRGERKDKLHGPDFQRALARFDFALEQMRSRVSLTTQDHLNPSQLGTLPSARSPYDYSLTRRKLESSQVNLATNRSSSLITRLETKLRYLGWRGHFAGKRVLELFVKNLKRLFRLLKKLRLVN